MSQKRIKAKVPNVPGVPRELLEVSDKLTLDHAEGDENYTLALQTLLDRFATSDYARKTGKNPEQLTMEGVYSLISILDNVFPRNSVNRPLSVPEVALLFGAVVGTAASSAVVHNEVTIREVEAQVNVFWVAMREWLTRGYLAVKHIEAKGAPSGLVGVNGKAVN